MRSIKRLPDSVSNAVRSGIILFDLTRIVEELIFNSLDAAATKVSVFVGVATCYVKVVDDGSGISRDGLQLLGERYATSKLCHRADMDAAGGSFGFRGEALASISDVSLLEIVTRAGGRPNGYRKVIKGSKCLYLGIDDDRKDVGTTVVVRDLFYNQPVRRRCMQSSPKKVLHTVKKCVLRIAFVHPTVSFKVVDVESEDEILCMHPSASPLSQLMGSFGIEDPISLHELNVSDGIIKLSGYISGPGGCLSRKAFQYVYINSRFVCKGPIHKLLNLLAANFESLDQLKPNYVSQKGKRSRSQAYPAFLLDINCPCSLYDLTLEPSKTYAEFKDWEPILTFIEKAVQHLWREDITSEPHGSIADKLGKDGICKEDDNVPFVKEDLFNEDLPRRSQLAIKKCRIQNHQEFLENDRECNDQQTEMELVHHTDYSIQPLDASPVKCNPPVTQRGINYTWTSDNCFLLPGSSVLENRSNSPEISYNHEGKNLSSQWDSESLRVGHVLSSGPAGNALSFDCHEISNRLELGKDIKKPFLQSCSSRESLPLDGNLFTSKDEIELSIDGLRTKQKKLWPSEGDIPQGGIGIQCVDFFSRCMLQDKMSSAYHASMTKGATSIVSDIRPGPSVKPFTFHREPFANESEFLSNSAGHMGNSGSDHQSFSDEWCCRTSDPLFEAYSWELEDFSKEVTLEGTSRLSRWDNCGYFADTAEKRRKTSNEILSGSSIREKYTSSSISTEFYFKDHNNATKGFCKFFIENSLGNKFCVEHSDRLIDNAHQFFPDAHGERCIDNNGSETQRDRFRDHVIKERSKRSLSAPPFYKQRMRFISLSHHPMIKTGKSTAQTFPSAVPAGLNKLQSSSVCDQDLEPGFATNLGLDARPYTENKPDSMMDIDEIQKGEKLEQFKFSLPPSNKPAEDLVTRNIQDSINSRTKWRNGCPEILKYNRSGDIHDRDDVLNISSGFLHLSAESLVPEFINKNFLEDAKVLQQVDKKFIPVVAGGTLVIIDQHAADERIRLEELRQKVLSGEGKTIAYLDTEQEMILPEIGYQLLHNYAEQVKNWGWICNIHSQGSSSFKKSLSLLHRQPTVVTLLAVPCILGVNLSDIDLLEFIQQLADTDGSSTMPPSVLRVLNLKACRGAIMFGDSLLPSECSLIVEELKQTSLCFQCAHGRPTTVPLVNLEALHKQIAKLGVSGDGSTESWHGLRRHEFSLERAAQHLKRI